MSLNVLNRRVHYWVSIAIAVPFGLIVATGVLLQVKKHWTFVQPPEQRVQVDAPLLSLPAILELVRAVPELGVRDWSDIAKLDVRPDKGVAKVILKSNWEAQVHLGTGEILQTAYRRSDLIETLHDGSFFAGDVTKLGLFLPVGLALSCLWMTGLWMWWVPFSAKRRRRQGPKGPAVIAPAWVFMLATGAVACGSAPLPTEDDIAPVPLVGHWAMTTEDGRHIATADATAWNGQPRADAEDGARQLFGSADAGLVANVSAPGAFPIAIWPSATPFASGTASVEFKLIAGESDQIAGLVFGLQPNGEYYYARYNTKDDDVALWRYAEGERQNLAHGEGRRRLPLGEWHRLAITLTGQHVTVEAAGDLRLEYDLPGTAAGLLGVWAKRDSVTAFRDLRIDTAGDAQAPALLLDRVDAYLQTSAEALVDVRHDLHQYPEPSGAEVRTATVVADQLRALGYTVRTGVGGHGVVAVLTGGRPGPLVAYRADMDAVRSAAPDPVAFRSRVPGVRHICGHDLHVTIGLALAGALSQVKVDVPGRVMFIFQPAEERATGAQAMLADGLFAQDTPVAIYGVHTSPYEVGRLSVKPDVMMLPNPAGVPGAINDPGLTAAAKEALIARLGAEAVIDLEAPPEGFSEDFGWYQEQVPGVFFFLGASNTAAGLVAAPHSPAFALDDAAIGVGARAMAVVLLDRLTR